MNYKIMDIIIKSSLILPELTQTGAEASIRVEPIDDPGNQTLLNADPSNWIHSWQTPTTQSICYAKTANGNLLRFPNRADFYISNNWYIQYRRYNGTSSSLLRHLLLDQTIPRLMGQLGKLVLHASAILTPDDRCIVFVGESGSGKSTLAAICANHGAKILTDDCLLLHPSEDGFSCQASYPSLRLTTAAAAMTALATQPGQWCDNTEKFRFGQANKLSSAAPNPEPGQLATSQQTNLFSTPQTYKIAGIFLLEPDKSAQPNLHQPASADISISQTTDANSLMALLKQIFLLNPQDNAVATSQFKQLAALIRVTPMFRLQFSHNKHQLNQLHNKILAICHNL
ncbi:MAG: hypothetical protein KUG79_18665 [Pseudomonadales bacterium]|nr:hypothetical protein [Pseudomonadales bacterium]